MAESGLTLKTRGFLETERRDLWWAQPLVVLLVLGAFVVYATWAALQGNHYTWGPYLSPFYSPEIFGDSSHSWFGPRPAWWPALLPFSPAILILWAPGGFRMTCYYYRGAYYKSFWADPPACAVGEPRKGYRGEASLPLILQNVHRYFLYLALGFLLVLAWDVWKALWFTDPATGVTSFGIGLGTLVLAANVTLLSGYTLGCHSLRHLTGGARDEISRSPVCQYAYTCSSRFNRRHMLWAWMSLFSVALSDVYVRLLSMGVISDSRLF
ncbi:MAG TPA: succinate dehydrogenase [Vicinamibacteria bacterium]|jgi:hypothetical protein